jgi:tetratricopeptide (TPR) repeat protein
MTWWASTQITVANHKKQVRDFSSVRKVLELTEKRPSVSRGLLARLKYVIARTYDQKKKDQAQLGLEVISKAIDLDPTDAGYYGVRAALAKTLGKDSKADDERRHRIIAAYGHNSRAWRLATNVEAAKRDGLVAVELARQACDACLWKKAGYLDTLAAAYAEIGDFQAAVRWQQRALDLVEGGATGNMAARLELYRAGKPYREAELAVTSPLPPLSAVKK